MIILILTILSTIIGIVLMEIYTVNKCNADACLFIGLLLSIVSGIFLIIELGTIVVKPFDYQTFKIEYETVTEIMTSSEDIRDTNYTMKIIEINEEIKRNQAYIDNPWVSIFYNKDIANMELLVKE
jgi:hypothetical protein